MSGSSLTLDIPVQKGDADLLSECQEEHTGTNDRAQSGSCARAHRAPMESRQMSPGTGDETARRPSTPAGKHPGPLTAPLTISVLTTSLTPPSRHVSVSTAASGRGVVPSPSVEEEMETRRGGPGGVVVESQGWSGHPPSTQSLILSRVARRPLVSPGPAPGRPLGTGARPECCLGVRELGVNTGGRCGSSFKLTNLCRFPSQVKKATEGDRRVIGSQTQRDD